MRRRVTFVPFLFSFPFRFADVKYSMDHVNFTRIYMTQARSDAINEPIGESTGRI